MRGRAHDAGVGEGGDEVGLWRCGGGDVAWDQEGGEVAEEAAAEGEMRTGRRCGPRVGSGWVLWGRFWGGSFDDALAFGWWGGVFLMDAFVIPRISLDGDDMETSAWLRRE